VAQTLLGPAATLPPLSMAAGQLRRHSGNSFFRRLD